MTAPSLRLSDSEISAAVDAAKVVCVHSDAKTTLDIGNAVQEAILARAEEMLSELTGAVRCLLAFHEPGETHVKEMFGDTNAWQLVSAYCRSALKRTTGADAFSALPSLAPVYFVRQKTNPSGQWLETKKSTLDAMLADMPDCFDVRVLFPLPVEVPPTAEKPDSSAVEDDYAGQFIIG